MSARILIIDDEPMLLRVMRNNLEKQGYEVLTASDGQEALRLAFSERPDLLILDIMMPKMDGYEVCQRIREMSDIPIIMVTAKGDKEDVIKGLNMGADDYLTKPVHLGELLARVRSSLRRSRCEIDSDLSTLTYDDGYLSINIEARRVLVAGELVKLTPTEYSLLALLVKNRGRVLEFRQLLETVWGFEYIDEVDYLHIYIWHLRQKIEPDPKNPRYLISEFNVGYRFEPQN